MKTLAIFKTKLKVLVLVQREKKKSNIIEEIFEIQ